MINNQYWYLILDASCLMTHGSWLTPHGHGRPGPGPQGRLPPPPNPPTPTHGHEAWATSRESSSMKHQVSNTNIDYWVVIIRIRFLTNYYAAEVEEHLTRPISVIFKRASFRISRFSGIPCSNGQKFRNSDIHRNRNAHLSESECRGGWVGWGGRYRVSGGWGQFWIQFWLTFLSGQATN